MLNPASAWFPTAVVRRGSRDCAERDGDMSERRHGSCTACLGPHDLSQPDSLNRHRSSQMGFASGWLTHETPAVRPGQFLPYDQSFRAGSLLQ